MKVKADIEKNRLYLNISGNISKAELNRLYTDVRFCVADLQPGFGVISDLSECSLAHLSGVSVYKKIMNYVIINGVGEVVRVINGDSLLFKQVMNLSSIICGYIPIYVSTLEEAEERLNDSNRRNGLRFHYKNLQPIEYVVNGTKGKGCILNISTSGCLVGSPTISPLIDEEILMVIQFDIQDTFQNEFTIKGRVLRKEGDRFGIKYEDFDDARRKQLWDCLLRQFEYEL